MKYQGRAFILLGKEGCYQAKVRKFLLKIYILAITSLKQFNCRMTAVSEGQCVIKGNFRKNGSNIL